MSYKNESCLLCSLFPPKRGVLEGGWLQGDRFHFNKNLSLL